ncbi:MAG: hypothetical protein Ct9H90mP16_18510 [Candidatus Poseidoniales archaeon]|nr:MAG: hypothetical protein Ct9H90mP16_18510 [Candidatus Poseidoniales archaeon]
MKAILVAGGHGSRLYPFTRYTHKTLLPLHRRPVIDYALATIRRSESRTLPSSEIDSLDKSPNTLELDCQARTFTMSSKKSQKVCNTH